MTYEKLLGDILTLSKEIIFLTDEDLFFVFINDEMEKVLEYPASYVRGKNLFDFVDKSGSALKGLIGKEGNGTVDISLVSKSKQVHRFRVNFSIREGYLEEDGRRGILWMGVPDVHLCFKIFRKELIRLNRLAEVGQLAAGIVHELKNPLTVINQAAGWGKVLVNDNKEKLGEDGEELEKVFEEIENQTLRCRDITNELLAFVRDSAPEKGSFSVVNLIEDTLKLLKSELKSPEIVIERRYEHKEEPITSDFRLLQQVLINLFSNAIDAIRQHNKSDGRLIIKTKTLGDKIRIAVEDNGGGIPPDVANKIFDMFYTTKPLGKGTGLGLPLCREIMNKLGGEIGFSTEVGRGTEFYIIFPNK